MTPAEIRKSLAVSYPECLLADGFDNALIGLVEGACREPVVCYDYEKCVEILMAGSSMSEEEAEEFLDFNTLGAYVGKMTPLFVHDWRK